MGLHTVSVTTVHLDNKGLGIITPREVILLPMVLEEASFIAWVISFVEAGAAVGAEADTVVGAEVGAAVDKAGGGAEALEEVVTDEIKVPTTTSQRGGCDHRTAECARHCHNQNQKYIIATADAVMLQRKSSLRNSHTLGQSSPVK